MGTTGQRTLMHRNNDKESRSTLGGHRLASLLCMALAVGSLPLYAQQGPVRHVEVPVDQSGFHPTTAQDVTLSFDGMVATFKASSPMTVVMESAGSRKTVTLPVEFNQFTSARLYRPDRLVISGMVNGDVWEVVIVDPEKGSVVDHFVCYSPAISPDGRYVAFVKFFPAHGVDSVEDHEMLYDVALSPEQNRPPRIAHHLYLYLAGKVVFPPGLANRLGDNIDIGDVPAHMMASDGFFWNDQSTSVVFADQFRDEYAVVVVKIVNGAFTSDSASIPKQWICPDITPCFEHLARADFRTSPARSIDVVFRGVNGTPAKETHVVILRNDSGRLAATPTK